MSSAIKDKQVDDQQAAFDRSLRQLHAAAVAQISPQTLARLRSARHGLENAAAPRRGHAWRWLAASAFSAVLAVAIGLQFMPRTDTVPAAQPLIAATDAGDDYASGSTALDENPDLYLWLASSEAEPLAME